ncbi:uncharacterized protein LOC135693472 [Rhopilema esculentum]|uniref:uncharacterized protein LOC135693472 n=1 Tax=Rhopilema esculentum TaxID=499914 RepID=UPI0031D2314D|eukprot:gene10540-19269_t
MAFTAKKLPVASDNVIYEHIIPRSVRQQWMRRASVDPLELVDATPKDKHYIYQDRRGPDGTSESTSKNSVANTDNNYGSSIVSHDIQEIHDIKLSEALISPEEELAVFTAFGVKLRHTSRDKIGKKRLSNLFEGKLCQNLKEEVEEIKSNKPLQPRKEGGLEFETNSNNVSDSNIVKLRGSIKKARPMSMPIISQESVLKLDAEMAAPFKERPKAYISPIAKVPWRRNLTASADNNSNISNRETRNQKGKEDSNDTKKAETPSFLLQRSQTLNHKEKGNKLDSESPKIEDLRKRPVIEEKAKAESVKEYKEGKNSWPSISERCQSFEHLENGDKKAKIDLSNRNIDKNTAQVDTILSDENTPLPNGNDKQLSILIEHISEQPNDIREHAENELNFTQHKETETRHSDVDSKDSSFKEISFESVHANGIPLKESNDTSENKNTLPIKDNNYKALLNIFKKEPITSQEDQLEYVNSGIDSKGKKENRAKLQDEDNSVETFGIDHVIAPSTLQNYEKKINKMIIRTGEQREKQLHSSKNKDLGAHKLDVQNNLRLTDGQKTKEKRKLDVIAPIPVTNLDDMMPVSNGDGSHIPVTNLDEPSECVPKSDKINKHSIGNTISKQEDERPKTLTSKKPGKYDADRRELVAPKVYFEKPVTGLVSSLSSKGKKGGKKKMRVSFSTGDLEKVHMYPSEIAAVQIYDEAHATINDDSITNIDDAFGTGSSPSDFQSYVPNSFINLSNSLERERSALTKMQPSNSPVASSDEKSTNGMSQSNRNDTLFTEAATSGTVAMLF